jgi:hypothetical protein
MWCGGTDKQVGEAAAKLKARWMEHAQCETLYLAYRNSEVAEGHSPELFAASYMPEFSWNDEESGDEDAGDAVRVLFAEERSGLAEEEADTCAVCMTLETIAGGAVSSVAYAPHATSEKNTH